MGGFGTRPLKVLHFHVCGKLSLRLGQVRIQLQGLTHGSPGFGVDFCSVDGRGSVVGTPSERSVCGRIVGSECDGFLK